MEKKLGIRCQVSEKKVVKAGMLVVGGGFGVIFSVSLHSVQLFTD